MKLEEVKIIVYNKLFPNLKYLPQIKGEDLDEAIEITYKELTKPIDVVYTEGEKNGN